jgi:hypothetical protein
MSKLIPTPTTIGIVSSNDEYWQYVEWLSENIPDGDVTYFWPYARFTFGNESDALMFKMKFGGVVTGMAATEGPI